MTRFGKLHCLVADAVSLLNSKYSSHRIMFLCFLDIFVRRNKTSDRNYALLESSVLYLYGINVFDCCRLLQRNH